MITASERRQDRAPFMVFHAKNKPVTTATKDQPQRAKPATVKAIFNIEPMLIGRFENRCFLFFSAVRIIILTFFKRYAVSEPVMSDRVSGAEKGSV